ncbi:MAG TPA: histidine kinase [Thermoanaerobaculia bacterium]|nr:histidine kinase [Thermoanaerobaculia bacterium]
MNDAPRLLRTSLAIIAVWLAYALYEVAVVFAAAALSGESASLRVVVWRQTAIAVVWILFTPLVVAISQAVPFTIKRWRNVPFLIAGVAALAALRGFVGAFVEHDITRVPFSWKLVPGNILVEMWSHAFNVVAIIGAAHLYRAYRESVERQRQLLAARTRLSNVERDELRAHLQPDFLFLTLERISRIVQKDPAAADTMIVSLGDLLRQSLAANTSGTTWDELLDLLDRYVALHAAASQTPVAFHIDAQEQLPQMPMQFAVMLPLVETAVSHVIAAGGGSIDLTVAAESERLRVALRGEGADEREVNFDALRAQLERIFDAAFVFEVTQNARTFTATLEVPAQ